MSRPNETILAAAGIHKTLGRSDGATHVLRGLDLNVRPGEFLAVMGPSGCGKSTLLHVLGLMTPADAGDLSIDGSPVPDSGKARAALRRRDIGFVFQRYNLLGTLSAAANIAVSLKVRGLPRDGRITDLLETLGVAHVAKRKPSQMSMGQQQRVAVVRALAHGPKLLLADEPTGNLDSDNSAALLKLFRTINRQQNQTLVMITHSADAAACADRIVHMKDGRILDND